MARFIEKYRAFEGLSAMAKKKTSKKRLAQNDENHRKIPCFRRFECYAQNKEACEINLSASFSKKDPKIKCFQVFECYAFKNPKQIEKEAKAVDLLASCSERYRKILWFQGVECDALKLKNR